MLWIHSELDDMCCVSWFEQLFLLTLLPLVPMVTADEIGNDPKQEETVIEICESCICSIFFFKFCNFQPLYE